MSGRVHVRQPGRPRGRPGPRRASARLTPVRALAALAVLAAAAGTWGVTASAAFAVRGVDVVGLHLTPSAAVRSALGVTAGEVGENAFTIRTDDLRDRLLALPTIADASVRVVLPASLQVTVTERQPILVWQVGTSRLLVDRDGFVIADAGATDATDEARQAAARLPVVDDRRTSRWPLADDWRPAVRQAPRVGAVLQPLELGIALQLLPLTPSDVGSTAPGLTVAVDDADGWTVQPAAPDPWTAVFGFYSTTLRPPDLVADQVRLLRSLIKDHESTYSRIVLADATNGTYTVRKASPTPGPSDHPKPSP